MEGLILTIGAVASVSLVFGFAGLIAWACGLED
jgi:hypothetical protein